MAAVLLGSEQVPPLSARVKVTVVVTVAAFVTAQFVKPLVSSTVGVAGTVKIEVAFGNAIETVSPARSCPLALEVKPTVQVPRAVAASVVEAKVTAVGVVAAAITGGAAGFAAVVSLLVLTCQRFAAGDPAAPEVTPTIWNERTVPLAITQLVAESSSVIVTVCPAPVAEAVHRLKPSRQDDRRIRRHREDRRRVREGDRDRVGGAKVARARHREADRPGRHARWRRACSRRTSLRPASPRR